jgi:hypothetical protein
VTPFATAVEVCPSVATVCRKALPTRRVRTFCQENEATLPRRRNNWLVRIFITGIKPDRFLQLSIPSAHNLFRMRKPDLKSIKLEILEPPDDLVERLH